MCHPRSVLPLLRGLLSALFLSAIPSPAHQVTSASLMVNLDTKAATYVLDAAMEVAPSADAETNAQISPEDAAREFASYLIVMFDEAEHKPELSVAVEETSDADTPPELRRQQVVTTFKGKIPEGAKDFLLYLDPRCPMAVVMVAIKDQLPSRRMQVILAGEYSRPVSVAPLAEGDPFLEGAPMPVPPAPAETSFAAPATSAARGPFAAGFLAFFQSSALPVLLVVGTLLLTLGRGSVLIQIGLLLLTLALFLSLAAWSLVPVPEWAAAALAGATALIAGEAWFHRRLRVWRVLLLVPGGLALGATLAGGPAFRGIVAGAEPATGTVIAYVAGVEVAMLLTGLAAAAILLPLSRFAWYRQSVVTPLAVGIAGYAIFRMVEQWL